LFPELTAVATVLEATSSVILGGVAGDASAGAAQFSHATLSMRGGLDG
jgi:hypothetical protein